MPASSMMGTVQHGAATLELRGYSSRARELWAFRKGFCSEASKPTACRRLSRDDTVLHVER